MHDLAVDRNGVTLSGRQAGEGIPVVLLHGLTATRRYVVMGSRALERSGHRVIGYDARGHGDSLPASEREAYDYVNLARDLEAVMDGLEIERAVLAGASMGAHTILRFALATPWTPPCARSWTADTRSGRGLPPIRQLTPAGCLHKIDYRALPSRG